jgi:tyrosine-protein phosphatase
MATTTVYMDADSPARKRSISENDSPTFAVCPSPKKVEFTVSTVPFYPYAIQSAPRRSPQHYRKSSWEKGRRATNRTVNMQAPNSSPFAVSIPSFMSVIEQEANHSEQTSQTNIIKESHGHDQIFSPIDAPSFNPFHQARHSTSTSASESTDSSPTTTVSLDSSSMTEPSPGPSPQSPTAMSFAMNESRFTPIEAPSKPPTLPTLPVFEVQQRPTLASKRPRNLKNLAVNTTASYNLGRAIVTAPLKPEQSQKISAPASPAFMKPPSPPKRKLGKMSLSIITPANPNGTGAVPSTPSITRPATLRHFQSSPSLPLYTSGAGPSGGMTLPRARVTPALRGFAEVTLEEDEDEQNFDVPQSREDKPESYPNGPIRIYESGVDLYYEPNVEVASRYDVIFNVASEVKNPFDVAEEAARLGASAPQTTQAVGVISDNSLHAGSPTTPKATPITTEAPVSSFPVLPTKRPEYIHIPWEHNTNLVPELHELVKVIDDRVKKGKKVLVHCQCGVSRSATLIVAYGLYTNPELNVPDAYDAVKKRSKWIAPNMNLIMQLTEFKNGLASSARRDHGFQSQVFKLPSMPHSGGSSITSNSFDVKTPSEPNTPRTAPYSVDGPASPHRLNSSAMGPFSARPIEPSSGSFWDNAFKRRSWGSGPGSNDITMPNMSTATDTNYVDASGHVVPVTVVKTSSGMDMSDSGTTLAPPPKRTSKRDPGSINRPLPFRRDYAQEDTQMSDAPPLFSPRATEFHMAPLQPPPHVQSADMFGIMSPTSNEFPTQLVDAPESSEPFFSPRATEFHMAPLLPPKNVQSEDLFNLMSPTSTDFPNPMAIPLAKTVYSPPPPPARAAPLPPIQRMQDTPMDSLNSIFSPTTTSFPSLFPVQPLDVAPSSQLELPAKQQERTDSMAPMASPLKLSSPPTPNRRLRKKFSAPNLSECIKLQKIQSDIASQLPKRPAEAEEALMSPRVGEFMANPFHATPIKEESAVLDETRENTLHGDLLSPMSEGPVTPTKNDIDPRSPAQFGISPITRSIWDVI